MNDSSPGTLSGAQLSPQTVVLLLNKSWLLGVLPADLAGENQV